MGQLTLSWQPAKQPLEVEIMNVTKLPLAVALSLVIGLGFSAMSFADDAKAPEAGAKQDMPADKGAKKEVKKEKKEKKETKKVKEDTTKAKKGKCAKKTSKKAADKTAAPTTTAPVEPTPEKK